MREWFLLRNARRVAAGTSDAARAEVRALAVAVKRRLAMAREAADEHYESVALALLRQALLIAATAVLVGRGARPPGSTLRPAELLELVARGELPELDVAVGWASVRELVSNDDPAALDRVNGVTAKSSVQVLAKIVKTLERGYEVRSPRRLDVLKWVRIVAGILLLLGLLSGVIVWALTPTNIAFHKHVTASSRHAGTGSASGIVDGVRTGPWGAHTDIDGKAWLLIDLLRPYRLRRVVVYNRGDERYYADMLPLVIELSLDGKTFERAARREGTFGIEKPWHAHLPGLEARYVRLRVDRKDAYIALSEVEVFGDPVP